ncbi:hypothetical protein BDD43_2841 [Mucilaginibacter gracilis]|uniref:Uncharacterized protein n=1 Tax=Mucilaginibacter gracilis TaxID=423350 RepID=A0A495J0Z3_9SPHI|nr:hypothetical protein [Mucilaginibacter gracilis]RKR82656.1 hypothetical protein BDD43_2841 [Mucilaginibacter gracilis]
MNRRKAIESIFKATKAIENLISGTSDFEAVRVKDGDTMVNYGELVKGAAVEISTSTGSEPAPDGEYNLSNGVSFTAKDGKIDKVIADGKSEEDLGDDEDSTDEDLATVAPEVEDETKEVAPEAENPTLAIQTLIDKINELEGIIKTIQGVMPTMPTKQEMSAVTDEIQKLNKAIGVLAETPAEFSKVNNTIEAKNDKASKLEALASLMK